MQQITLAVGKLLQSGSHPKNWLVSSSRGQVELEAALHQSPVQRQLQPCAGTIQWQSPSVMMGPKKISFGTPPTADVCVLFEDKIWAMLVWICYKLCVKLLLTHISFSSPFYNSVFEASRARKWYIWEMLLCLLKTAPGIMSWLNSWKYSQCQRQFICIGCTS